MLSKKQKKKLAKFELRLASRKERRQQEKLKRKEKKANARVLGIKPTPKPKLQRMADSECKLNVAVDLAYEEVILSLF